MSKKVIFAFVLVYILILGGGVWAYMHYTSTYMPNHSIAEDKLGSDFFNFSNVNTSQEHYLSIEEKYITLLLNLEEEAENRLQQLLNSAAQEYTESKEDGTLNTLLFANQYYSAIQLLEKSVDSSIQSLLFQMRTELEENQLSTDITDELYIQYQQNLKTRKDELIQQAMKFVR